jgi:aryl-alcohol dehydrogenase-like predicted oxidoreductase
MVKSSHAHLGIGTAAFAPGYSLGGDAPSKSTCVDMLRASVAAGIRYIDTAPAYDEAERMIAEVAGLVESSGVRVCTKVGRGSLGPASMRQSVLNSLERLRLASVDTVMLHSADARILGGGEINAAFSGIVREGLTNKCGASTYGAADASMVLTEPWCGAIQIEHSILNPSVVGAIENKYGGVEVVARSVLCKGLLTSRWRAASAISDRIAETLEALEQVSAEWGWPLAEMAIRFALDTPGVSIVLVGVTNDAELQTALRAAQRPPLDAERRALMTRFNRADNDATHPERWTALAERDA